MSVEPHGEVVRGGMPDRVQDAVSTLLRVVLVLGSVAALIAGLWVFGAVSDSGVGRRADSRVAATLLADTAVVPADGHRGPVAVRTAATWVGPDAVRREGAVSVLGPRAAGSTVTVRVDRHGTPVAARLTPVPAAFAGVLAGLAVFLAVALPGAGAAALTRGAIERRTARRWEREWERVEPTWSGRRTGG